MPIGIETSIAANTSLRSSHKPGEGKKNRILLNKGNINVKSGISESITVTDTPPRQRTSGPDFFYVSNVYTRHNSDVCELGGFF